MHPNHKLILIPAEDNAERMQAYGQTKLIQQTLQPHLRPNTQTRGGRRPGQMTGRADKADPECSHSYKRHTKKSLCVISQNGCHEKLFNFQLLEVFDARIALCLSEQTVLPLFLRPLKLHLRARLPRVMKGKEPRPERSESSASSCFLVGARCT